MDRADDGDSNGLHVQAEDRTAGVFVVTLLIAFRIHVAVDEVQAVFQPVVRPVGCALQRTVGGTVVNSLARPFVQPLVPTVALPIVGTDARSVTVAVSRTIVLTRPLSVAVHPDRTLGGRPHVLRDGTDVSPAGMRGALPFGFGLRGRSVLPQAQQR